MTIITVTEVQKIVIMTIKATLKWRTQRKMLRRRRRKLRLKRKLYRRRL